MMRARTLSCVLALMTLIGAASANAQNHDSFHRVDMTRPREANRQPLRVGQRMAAQMIDRMQRFKGLPHDSALKLLYTQSKHHMIVVSQCDFELHFSRQNANPAWQALSDSVARDTRRIVLRHERLSNAEINEVLSRAARMAQFCLNARAPEF